MTSEIYKRYRPRSLKKIVGNEETVASLQSFLKKDSLPHTILFSGPSGCGKTTLARILKDTLHCSDMDFAELNCSSHRGIDTIRNIQSKMRLAPTGGDCRVWLLDESHQLSKDAQNAALKMLEDTPAHVYFLLCTTDPQKLLPTIRTRCTKLPVSLLDDKQMTALVRRVAEREGIDLSEESLLDLIENASGSPRTALVLLDKVSGLPDAQRSAALKELAVSDEAVIDLARALVKKAGWLKIGKILKGIQEDPEKIRWAVLGYARSTLLNSPNEQAYHVICAFENHFYDSGHAGVVRACWEALHGE